MKPQVLTIRTSASCLSAHELHVAAGDPGERPQHLLAVHLVFGAAELHQTDSGRQTCTSPLLFRSFERMSLPEFVEESQFRGGAAAPRYHGHQDADDAFHLT